MLIAWERKDYTIKTKKVVHSCINRNPHQRQEIITPEMNISHCSVSHIINNDLHLQVYKKLTGQLFMKSWGW